MKENIKTDILIVGGGIAGLWTYRVLKDLGYHVILIEEKYLGQMQTLGSQGMIHGGQRYHLQGTSNDHGDKISEMPRVWNECLAGNGVIDLSKVKILAQNQYLWSPGGLASNVATFMASKAMNSKVKNLKTAQLPEIFKMSDKFKGVVYEMDECVVEVKSLLNEIMGPYTQHVLQTQLSHVEKTQDGKYLHRCKLTNGDQVEIESSVSIFAAGTGNEIAISNLRLDCERPQSQRRPLKQIMIREVEFPLYAHCITTDPRPRMTVTAHPLANGKYVWYLGGIVAEYGIDKSDEEAIKFAKKEVIELFPWIDWSQKEWSCFNIDRAEPYFDLSFFKSGPELLTEEHLAVAWPTKLTFAPALARQIVEWIESKKIEFSKNEQSFSIQVPLASLGQYPWDETIWSQS